MFQLSVGAVVTVSSSAISGYFTTQTGLCRAPFRRLLLHVHQLICRLVTPAPALTRYSRSVSIVDNTGAPTLKQASDFQIAIKEGSAVVSTFAGSTSGINVGLTPTLEL